MRRLLPLLLLLLAVPAGARPVVVGRVGLVAGGALSADAIGTGARDGRALVTVRIPGGADALRRAGFDAYPLAGDVAGLRADADELRRLLTQSAVLTVEERRILQPLLDASGLAIGAPAARAETGLDGRGVLVGVVDTGADFRHADLRRADGSTRIAAMLDFAHPRGGLHPELPDYNGGALWLRGDIDAALAAQASGIPPAVSVDERDTNGHGTHVSGIALSNGLATDRGFASGRYVGIAPGAELIAVQGTHGNATFTDSDVLVGCRFAVEQAQRLGQPLVVNLSLGSNGGPHDGTSDLELALDQLFPVTQPGLALVVAAGNEGARDQHAGAWALDGTVSMPVSSPTSHQPDAQLAFEIWYAGSLSISVRSPSGRVVGPVAHGAMREGAQSPDGQVLIDNGSSSPRRADGRQAASVTIVGPTGAAPAAGIWTLVFDGQASRWDTWITTEPTAGSSARFLETLAEDDRLALPGTARSAITVGSFVTRNQWTTIDAKLIARTQVIGSVSSFSSSGPTADGRFAPDVLAPGEYIMSTLSSDASPDNPSSAFFYAPGDHLAWGDDGLHAVLRGTSQAAPHVTGAAALLLQANPTLTGNQLREILRVTSRDEGRGFTPRYGFGKLDVVAALRFLGGARGSAVSPSASAVAVSRDQLPPGDDVTVVTVTPRADDGTAVGPGHRVTITASAGDPVGDVIDTGVGRYERTFAPHAPRGTTAVVSATVDGVPLSTHPSIYIVNSRADIGAPFAAGGCSVARSSTATAPGAVLLLAVVVIFVAARKSRRHRLARTLGA